MKITESFAVKEHLIGMEMYGFEFESNDNMCFGEPMISQVGEIGVIEYYNKPQDYVIVQFKDSVSWAYPADIVSHHLVNPLSSPTKAYEHTITFKPTIADKMAQREKQLTREDYEKVMKEFNLFEGHKDKLYTNDINFLDSIFPTPNKERIAEINKEMKRLRIERKSLEI